MTAHYLVDSRGFTLIEVMLFFAISGALMIGILASSSLTINTQRYRDAITTLQASIQQQYNETTTTLNNRVGSEDQSSEVISNCQGPKERGTNKCIILGRAITIDNTGDKLTFENVLGVEGGNSATLTNDNDVFQSYKLFKDSSSVETSNVAWGGTITLQPDAIEPNQPLTILILRSPLTGTTKTYSYTGSDTSNYIDKVNLTDVQQEKSRKMCVNPADFSLGSKLGVVLDSYATNANAVKLITESNACV